MDPRKKKVADTQAPSKCGTKVKKKFTRRIYEWLSQRQNHRQARRHADDGEKDMADTRAI